MNLEEIRDELEYEQTWRQDEIRFFRNQLVSLSNYSEQMQFRQALVLMLYAHYEGFSKFVFLQYVNAVNDSGVMCEEETSSIIVGTWERIFTALQTGDQKSSVFRSKLPNETRLHHFARRRDFIEQFSDFSRQIVQISDDAIDTESNLRPIVMKKNLYLLGLDHDVFSDHDGDIIHLINRRNNIAHELDRNGLDEREYALLESTVFKIMDDLMEIIMEAIQKQRYRRQY